MSLPSYTYINVKNIKIKMNILMKKILCLMQYCILAWGLHAKV